MASDTILRTAAGIISSGLYNDENLPFGPRKYGQSAPFVRENLNIQPIGGSAALNTTVTYRVRKQGDYGGRIAFRGTLRALPAPVVAGKFARYADGAPLFMIKECRIKYNSQKLQTIKPLELYLHQEFHQNDEEKANSNYNTLLNMPDAQRSADSVSAQNFKVNLYTAFPQHDQSNHLFVNGLANDLEVEFDFDSGANIVQSDDTATPYAIPADSTFLTNTALQVEYIHVTENKRQDMVVTYANPNGIRYLFNDYQYYNDRILGTTALNGSIISVQIRSNLNAPCSVLYVIFRWVADLTRSAPSLLGDGGRDYTNVGGWYAPTGNDRRSRLFTDVFIKSGNNDIVKQYPVEEYLWDKRVQFFVGTPGVAILAFSFADAPLLTNAHTGSWDPSVVDTPTLYLVTNAFNGTTQPNATINDAATSNIGGASDLQIDFVSESKNFVDILGHDAIRPFA